MRHPRTYRPTSLLTPTLIVLYLLGLAVHAVAVWSDCQEIQMLQTAQVGGDVDEELAETSDQRQRMIGIVQMVLGVSAWILFLIWVYRSSCNVWSYGVPDLQFTPGWSVGWFFVPVMNLFRPYQVLKEIWGASHPDPEPWDPGPAPVALLVWWGNWIVAWIAGRAAFRLTLRAKTLPEYLSASEVQLVSDLLDLPLMLLSVWLVWTIYNRQQAKHRWFQEQAALGEPAR